MTHATSTSSGAFIGFWLAAGMVAVAVLLGLFSGLVGWQGQILLLTVALPAALLIVDYRLGLIIGLLILPYTTSPLLPKAGPFQAANIVMLGTVGSFFLRWVISFVKGRLVVLPVTREVIWLYLVPLTVATCIGTFYLDEISVHYLRQLKTESFGWKDYWVSNYAKQLLLVLMGCIFGAAVVARGDGFRFFVVTVISGVLFVVAVIAVIVATGATLEQLQNVRNLMGVIGRHNNDAGTLILSVIAPTLFAREFVRHRLARVALLLAVLFMVGGLLLTMSRGAVVGLLVVLACYVWWTRRLGAILGALAVAIASFLFMPDAVRDRLLLGLEGGRPIATQIAAAGGDELTQGRVWIWRNLAPEILKSPLIGRGMMSTQWSTVARTGYLPIGHPHNLYLEILMDIGIIGAIVIALFYRYIWRLFRQLAADERLAPVLRGYFLGSAAHLLGMFAYGMTNGHWFPASEQLFFWAGIGLALGYQQWLAAQRQVAPQPRSAGLVPAASTPVGAS